MRTGRRPKARMALDFLRTAADSSATWSGGTRSSRLRLRARRRRLASGQARMHLREARLYLESAARQGMRAQLRVVGASDSLSNGKAKADAIVAANAIGT